MTLDNTFCHTCIKAIKLGKISAAKPFNKTGFRNWKKALEKNFGLVKHDDSNSHKKKN